MTSKKTKKIALPIKRTIKGSAKARRNAARLSAVQCVYQMRHSGMTAEQALGDYANNRMGVEEDGDLYVAADIELLRAIVAGVETRLPILTEMVSKALDPVRPFERQEQLLQAVLLCGTEELFAQPATDTALIVSNYVDVTKAFYDGRESAMINAALDNLAKVIRPQ